ncbi:ABC transporter ATP-binding protein [Nocardiopsis tropica]|uniref:ABC transporter ATP-binding protein n=1 Tax=Nocardiopsis tropica TaxID=109330 RepID=A0ABU7KPU7_9ACTN|nr:ABC transporter ATP-binding protein [Nocardiopsis umidischolae]MEE2051303.1 ABC transporter ATP-binding protein [Nocardiopsis umidischolae]
MLEHTSVAVTDLRKTYGKRPVLTGVSLEVRRGSRTVVLGPNGAGKSTLLEIVSTLRSPTSGTVVVEGRDVVAHTREARRLIGLTPQSNALDPLATPQEVLDFQGAALGLAGRAARRRSRELVDMFGLGDHRGTRVAKLSGGTRRKVDLAVALVGSPSLVVLDEPTTGLDPLARMDLWDELKRLNSDGGATLLISTQDLHEAEVLASDIVVLRDGGVAAHDSPDALKALVGERTLTLTLDPPGSADGLLGAGRAGFRTVPGRPGTVRLALPRDPAVLRSALDDIGSVAASVQEVRLADPSLDDVFAALAAG